MAKKNKNESAEKKAPVKTTEKSTTNTIAVNVDNEIKAEPVVKEQPQTNTANPLPAMMKNYIGTKTIKALAMTRGAYNKYRGWEIPADEDASEAVYLVEYPADPLSKPNHANHAGYISMSPKYVFDKAYALSETFLDRLHIEKDDLDLKIAKLKAGLSSGKVPKTEVAILNLQLNTMQHYSKILETRINSAK
jgi:hypothetical protein